MRKIIITTLLSLSITGFSQNLKTKLQGDWVCTGIINSSGDSTSGKFGASNEYLKFTFSKEYLSINESPIDNSFEFKIKYNNDSFEFILNSNSEPPEGLQKFNRLKIPDLDIKIPESEYFVKFCSNDQAILSTLNSIKDTIFYHFTKQDYFLDKLPNEKSIVDVGYVIIKHLKLSKDSDGANRVAETFVTNEIEHLYPAPLFKDYSNITFGHYVSINFKFPDSYKLGEVSEELVIEFDVNKMGVDSIEVVKGINEYFNASIVRIIEKSKKKWTPVQRDGEMVYLRLRIHFVFYLDIIELGIKFSD